MTKAVYEVKVYTKSTNIPGYYSYSSKTLSATIFLADLLGIL